MDLSTRYLGFQLKHPFMPGASPLIDDMDMVRRLEDAGAAAFVMHSLFEEQIALRRPQTLYHLDASSDAKARAISYFPTPEDFALNTDQYLERIRQIKAAVSVPVIASLNGTTPAWWTQYAGLIEQAGADAMELNIYFMAVDPLESSDSVDRRVLETVRDVKNVVDIPLAVKLSPFFSCLAGLAHKLDLLDVDGLILFNRFYQPDIDIDKMEVSPTLELSQSSELLLRLRWLAMLSGSLKGSLAVSGGIHSAPDAVKAILTGAHGVQMVSTLLRNGPGQLRKIREGVEEWMEKNGHHSLDEVRGRLNYAKYPDPGAFERSNYVRVMQSRKG